MDCAENYSKWQRRLTFWTEFFKSFMHGALRWFPVILSWASWLGIVMAYNKMSNPLANISWGNNSSHYFAQTVNCWETGLKFWLKRRKVRMYVSEYGNQLLLFSSLPKLNYCLRTNWLPLYEKCLHLVPNNIKFTKKVYIYLILMSFLPWSPWYSPVEKHSHYFPIVV